MFRGLVVECLFVYIKLKKGKLDWDVNFKNISLIVIDILSEVLGMDVII